MDAELARTIAAFMSLGFGFVIFCLLIYKVYLRSPKLEATVKKASIRAVEPGAFDCQIDLDINAKCGDVYLTRFALSHSVAVFDPDKGVNKHSISRIVEYPGYCLLDQDKEVFSEKMNALQSFDVTGVRISAGTHRSASIIERIHVASSSDDGYWNWPTEGWTLSLRSSSGRVEIPLAFTIHESSEVFAFCRGYASAKSLIWSC